MTSLPELWSLQFFLYTDWFNGHSHKALKAHTDSVLTGRLAEVTAGSLKALAMVWVSPASLSQQTSMHDGDGKLKLQEGPCCIPVMEAEVVSM